MGANAQTTVQKFLSGAVLTAEQQNTSAATGVPVFATTVTRDAAFGGANKVLAEGQTCYLEDANVVQYYDGAAWATVGPAAGGNLIINGNMEIAQRGTAAVTTSGGYGPCDRWINLAAGDTFSTTQVAFASGDALYNPTTGNTAAQFFSQVVVTSVANAANYYILSQRAENVRLMAGKTVTVSFWARATSGTPLIGVEFAQSFGTGGSPSADVNGTGQAVTLSTTWTKYTQQHTLGSLSGITLGTTANTSFSRVNFWLDAGSNFNTRSGSIGQATKTVSIAQVQVELGSTATSFAQEATGVTLARCQRYYAKTFPFATAPAQNTASELGAIFGGPSVTDVSFITTWVFPVRMRVAPTLTTFSPNAASSNWSNQSGKIPTVVGLGVGDSAVSLRGTTATSPGGAHAIHATAVAEL